MNTPRILDVCIVAVLLAAVDGAYERQILSLYSNNFTGDGTYYGTTAAGLCQLNTPDLPPVAKSPAIRYLVALNKHQMYRSLACGMCLKVHGTGQGLGTDPIVGDFYVYVKDMCPKCSTGDVDFATEGDGRWNISIHAVQCPVGSGTIEYTFQGSDPWYIKLQVRNERMPATQVDVFQLVSRSWAPLRRSTDGFWEFGYGQYEKPLQTPFWIRLHAPNGATIIDVLPRIENDLIIYGRGVQFPPDNSLPHA